MSHTDNDKVRDSATVSNPPRYSVLSIALGRSIFDREHFVFGDVTIGCPGIIVIIGPTVWNRLLFLLQLEFSNPPRDQFPYLLSQQSFYQTQNYQDYFEPLPLI